MENLNKDGYEKFAFRNDTKIKILDFSENSLITVSELKNKLEMTYKNIIANLNFLEDHHKIMRVSLKEQNNPTYIIPLQPSSDLLYLEDIEKNINILAPFSKHIVIRALVSKESFELRDIEKIFSIIRRYPDVKFDLNISYYNSSIKKYRIRAELISKKIEPIIKSKLKEMDKEHRSKLKFDLNGFINLLNN